MTMYGDGLNPQHDTREKVLAILLKYCEYNHTKKIQRNDLFKLCNLAPATFNRAINWAERQGALIIDDETKPGETWIITNFRAAKRELLRTAKRNVALNLPMDRVARPGDVLGRIQPKLHESVQVSDHVRDVKGKTKKLHESVQVSDHVSFEVRDAEGKIKKTG